MPIWIDVENSSGVRYGSGPITTATEWRNLDALDAMGSFAFSMPAADPQAALLANKRRVRCFLAPDDVGSWPGEIQEIGYGIIDNIDVRPATSGPTMLDISGPNLLVELANTTIKELNLYDDDVGDPDYVKHIITGGSTTVWSPGDNINLQDDPLSYMYIGNADAFQSVTFTLGTNKNAQTATLQAQYFNELADPMGWENIDITDGTASGGAPFAQNGTITFDMPSGWGKSTYGQYDLRIYCPDVNLGTVTFATIKVTVRNPTATALHDIVALAPSGWTLDPEGQLATATTVYQQLIAKSVLAALNWLAEQTGEHFLLSPAGRRVWWLGTAKQSSGLHVVSGDPGPSPDDYALYIRGGGVRLRKSTADLFTRIYPLGAGNGDDQITLADSSDSVWSNYTLDKVNNYVERDAAVTEFGRIDRWVDFPEIAPADSSLDARTHAGNMLLQRALETLERGSYEQRTYDLSVMPSRYRVYPGSTIYLSYHEWTDGYHAVNIDEELWVLAVETAVTPSGDVYTVGLTVAVVDAYAVSDGNRLALEVQTTWANRSQPLPLKGLISQGSGIPYDIGIKYGEVTTIKRQTPVADGTYTVDTLTITNGVITEITET